MLEVSAYDADTTSLLLVASMARDARGVVGVSSGPIEHRVGLVRPVEVRAEDAEGLVCVADGNEQLLVRRVDDG